MKYNHHIVVDLLPLYADGVCSKESAGVVRDHLEECEECRTLLNDLRDLETPNLPDLDSADVIKKTGRKITKEAAGNVIGVSLIVLFWITYAIIVPFANVGDYRFIPYSLWELSGLGRVLAPLATAIWLITVVVKNLREREWRRRLVILLVLVVLLIGQMCMIYVISQDFRGGAFGWVEEIGEGYFVLNTGEELIEISCGYDLPRLLKTDGTMYFINYYGNNLSPGKVTLVSMEEAGYNRSQTPYAIIDPGLGAFHRFSTEGYVHS